MKWFIFSLSAIAILISGLVSCSPDKRDRDVFRVAAPVLVNGSSRVSLKNFEIQKMRKLDVQDVLEFSTAATATTITAHCRKSDENFTQSFSFQKRAKISAFEFLPQAILTSDLSLTPVDCAFDLVLQDEVGSQHIFNISTVALADGGTYPVSVRREPVDPTKSVKGKLKFFFNDLPNVRIRYHNRSEASTQLICENVSFDELSFERVRNFDDFDLASRNPNPNLQNCRVLISEGGAVTAVSPLLKIGFPEKPLISQVIQMEPSRNDTDRDISPATWRRRTTQIGLVRLTNPDDRTRTLRVSKARMSDLTYLFEGTGLVSSDIHRSNSAYVIPEVIAPNKILEEKTDWIVTLAPKATFQLKVMHDTYDSVQCSKPIQTAIISLDQIEIDSLNSYNEISGVTKIESHFLRGFGAVYRTPTVFERYIHLPLQQDVCNWH